MNDTLAGRRRPRFKKVYLEIGNRCNLACSFCPQPILRRPAARMELELFRKLVAELAPQTRLFCLHVMGEPLLDERLQELLDILAEHRAQASIVTNGTLLRQAQRRALLHPAVRQVNFSLQSMTGTFGAQVRLQTYLQRILAFCDEASAFRPELNVNLRLWNGQDLAGTLSTNQEAILAILAHFGRQDQDLAALTQHGNGLRGRIFLNLSEHFDWSSEERAPISARGSCRGLQDMLAVLADGTVTPCCIDHEGMLDLGNARDRSIAAIMEGARATAIRTGFERGELVEDLCRSCTWARRPQG